MDESQVSDKKNLEELVRTYPNSSRRLMMTVRTFSIDEDDLCESERVQSLYVSPYGLAFFGNRLYNEGTLLKIYVPIPDYWRRKQRFVSYKRIDVPTSLQVLVKVALCQEKGKFGRRKVTLVEMLNIDRIDEEVLKEYLGEEKNNRSGFGEKLEVHFS